MLMMIRTITPQMDLVLFKTTSCFALLRYWPQDIQFFVNAIPSRRSWTSCQGLVVSRQYTLGKPSEASTGGWARKDVSGVSIYIYICGIFWWVIWSELFPVSPRLFFKLYLAKDSFFSAHFSFFDGVAGSLTTPWTEGPGSSFPCKSMAGASWRHQL